MNRRETSHTRPVHVTPLRALILVALVVLGLWLSRHEDRAFPQPASSSPPAEVIEPTVKQPPINTEASRADRETFQSQFPNISIRDLDGKVIFRGTMDVQPTLDRIAAGKQLNFRNDGSTFENREGRLPRKSPGYYKEYVHPTPSLSGPGPQRIVIGTKGEAYYTPDHYRTFHRIR